MDYITTLINIFRDFEEYDRTHHRNRYDFPTIDTSTPQGQAYAKYKEAREAFNAPGEKMRRFSEYLSLNRHKLESLEKSIVEQNSTSLRDKMEIEAEKVIKKAFEKFMRGDFS